MMLKTGAVIFGVGVALLGLASSQYSYQLAYIPGMTSPVTVALANPIQGALDIFIRAVNIANNVEPIAQLINSGVNGMAIRHPASGGQCLDVAGASPTSGARVITYPCSFPLGFLTPVNQRFTVMSGSQGDAFRFSPEFSHIGRLCIHANREIESIIHTRSCSDSDQDNMSWRFLDIEGRDPRVLMQQVSSNFCLLRDSGGVVGTVVCNPDDEQQHWIRCRSGDRCCGN